MKQALPPGGFNSVVRALCESADTPRALAVWLLYASGEHRELLNLPMPAMTPSISSFRNDYLVTEYLSKYTGLQTGYDLRQNALDKWILAEQQCEETNQRISGLRLRGSYDSRVEGYLSVAQRKISRVLGTYDVSKALSRCQWGPGGTYDLKRRMATRSKKISGPLTVTARALPYARAIVETDPHWVECLTGHKPEGPLSLLKHNFRIVPGSRFLTVPKSSKTDRCIAAEPTMNSFLQQGVSRYIRSRLLRFGINLDDQTRNQRLARDALDLGLATLDLSAASDTISSELIFHLLPEPWANLMDNLRSHSTRVDGRWVRTHKFASMGNAFCFELETLIFWAVVSSVISENQGSVDNVSVYGDDIIAPSEFYDEIVYALTYCGFTVNQKKSFSTGLFRESCGKHFYAGYDVTPVYQKALVEHPSEIVRAHNRLSRWVDFHHLHWRQPLRRAISLYPFRPLPRIPKGCVEDGGFLWDSDRFPTDPSAGYRCLTLDYVTGFRPGNGPAMLANKLRFSCNLNPDPKGQELHVTVTGRWRTRVRYIPYHSTDQQWPASDWTPQVL